MENQESRFLSLCSIRYEDILRELGIIDSSNKLQITALKITDSNIRILSSCTFNGFENLSHLVISKCLVHNIDESAFENLTNLKILNLSNNVISSIDKHLFVKNQNLETIIFEKNLLHYIDKSVFSMIRNFENLDLSSNKIVTVSDQVSNCFTLKILHLNNNLIKHIQSKALHQVQNLTHLMLNNNQIERLAEGTFKKLYNLRHLNLSDNLLNYLHDQSFWKMEKLNYLYLARNFLKDRLDKHVFLYNTHLIDLDLSDNYLDGLSMYALDNCQNLKVLKLTVNHTFYPTTITPLRFLSNFEFVCNQQNFSWNSNFRMVIESFRVLTILKLVFRKVDELELCNFSTLRLLEYLHIECVYESDFNHNFDFDVILPQSPLLKHLIFKKLNKFRIVNKCDSRIDNLKHLSLSGLKNGIYTENFFNYMFLESLDLSFSGIESIVGYTFKNLENLEDLNLQNSKLKSIKVTAFRNNHKLSVINFANCSIKTILGYTFSNLRYLREVDLSANPLQFISGNAFYGVDLETCTVRFY